MHQLDNVGEQFGRELANVGTRVIAGRQNLSETENYEPPPVQLRFIAARFVEELFGFGGDAAPLLLLRELRVKLARA